LRARVCMYPALETNESDDPPHSFQTGRTRRRLRHESSFHFTQHGSFAVRMLLGHAVLRLQGSGKALVHTLVGAQRGLQPMERSGGALLQDWIRTVVGQAPDREKDNIQNVRSWTQR
jgi:hypothetical protein